MDALQITSLLVLSLTVRGDYTGPSSSYGTPSTTTYVAPSTSYGTPSYDSHGGDHSHGPVKRHIQGGGRSSGGWYNGGSGGVQPGHSSCTSCSQNSPSPPRQNPCRNSCGQPLQQTGYAPKQPQNYPQPQMLQQPSPSYNQPPSPVHTHPNPTPPVLSNSNPPSPSHYQPPVNYQPNASPRVNSASPSPPITQPPPYPLPEGPAGYAASGPRPDYLPRYPAGHGGYGLSSRPYNFGYSVRDFHTGADFKQQETSDGNTVKGQYRVQLPDGRTQIVTYTADWQTGFHADVQYEGEASYPAVYGTGGSYPPSTVGTSYGTPSQPISNYGVPSHSSSSYSAGQPSTGYSPSTHGSSYQSRVGVGGVGTQYQNTGYTPAGGTSYGHPGY